MDQRDMMVNPKLAGAEHAQSSIDLIESLLAEVNTVHGVIETHQRARDWATVSLRLQELIHATTAALVATSAYAAVKEHGRHLFPNEPHDAETAARLAHNAGREHHAS